MPEMRVFSTAGLPAARRIELWEGHNTAALIGLSCHTAVPGALEATEVNVQLGRIQLARVTGSPHVVERTAEVIRRSPADAVAVYVTLRGDAWFRHEDGRRDLRPGQVLICDADRPFARGFARGLEELAIKVPRAALLAGTGLTSLSSPVVAAFARGNDPYARVLARLVDRAARAERPVAADEGTVIDLVATLPARRNADRTMALRAAARCFIEDHLADPGLGGPRRDGDRDQRAAPVPRIRGRRNHDPPARPVPPPAARLRDAGRPGRGSRDGPDGRRRRGAVWLHFGHVLLARLP